MNIMARAMTLLVLLCLGLPQTMPTNTPETPAKEEDILQKQDDLVAVKNDPGLEMTFETQNAEGMSVSRVRGSAPLPLYPLYLDELPSIPSPFTTADGTEVVVVVTKDKKYALFPVTVENGKPWKREGQDGKGLQLDVDGWDFPTLESTGLHSELELDGTRRLTGWSTAEITESGRPLASSGLGFMGADEDILSVLRGDNRLVKAMGLTHPRLARALFHVFNIVRILDGADQPAGQPPPKLDHFLYNGKKVRLSYTNENDCQPSIFNDEVLGFYEIETRRELEGDEKSFLVQSYPDLSVARMKALQEKLSTLHFGEMAAFYAMRYGFYEGHTRYRADPVSLACILGLKSVEELESAFPGKLERVLTEPHTGTSPPATGEGR